MSAPCKGVLGLFDDPSLVIAAVKAARHHGWRKFDVFAPFPVHGLSEAMEIPRSRIPWVTFAAGLMGAGLAFLFQAWTSAVDWPLNVGGKPFVSWPAFIPITFELTILISGLCTAVALAVVCKLPKRHEKVMALDLTDNAFGLYIPATEAGFNSEAIVNFLKEARANEVRVIHE